MPNIQTETKTIEDMKPRNPNQSQAEMRAALIFLLYAFGVTLALILATVGYFHRGSEIDRLKQENEAQRAKMAEIDHSPTPPPAVCGLEVVICPGEAEKPIIPAIPAKTPPNAQNGTTKASWYDYSIKGQVWSKSHRTAASRDFKRGTMLEVCHASKCVEVLVNDYGPALAVHPDRALDLSSYAFQELAPLSRGVIEVTYREIK